MTPKELAYLCALSASLGEETVDLVLPGAPSRRGVVRFAGPRSPRGELLCLNSDKEMVTRFNAIELLAYLAATDHSVLNQRPS